LNREVREGMGAGREAKSKGLFSLVAEASALNSIAPFLWCLRSR
jgi:hypothetical protein